MGIAWCRERIEQAQNSKSPVDRILVRCSNMIKPKTSYSHSQGKLTNDFVYRGMRTKNLGISNPVPIHRVPPRARRVPKSSAEYQIFASHVPDSENAGRPPVPPPRKKRKRQQTSLEMLNIQLPELNSPAFVLHSESLLQNQTFSKEKETDAADVLRPLKKSYYKERTSGPDRFRKLSGNRTRKNKREFHSNDERERIKNDNEKKTEQKIKHVSSVSLPNYNELVKPRRKVSADMTENGDDKNENQSAGLKHPRRNSSSISLPGEGSNSILSSLSEVTIHRLEAYMKKCRSFGSLKPQQFLEKLEELNKKRRSASESSDSWSGLDDWDLGIIEYCDPENKTSPVTPKSTLPPKQAKVTFSEPVKEEDDETGEREQNRKVETEMQDQKSSRPEETRPDENLPHIESVYIKQDVTVERVPLEWFLNPQRRPLPIMPSPTIVEIRSNTTTPPPSPAEETGSQEDVTQFSNDHCALLSLLKEIKDTGNAEPEIKVEVKELVMAVVEDPSKFSLTFDELNIDVPPKQDADSDKVTKNRSNSWVEEDEIKLLGHKRRKSRSLSVGFDSPPRPLEISKNDEEAMEKELILNRKDIMSSLRRESLCQSLPEDEFEAFLNKKKLSLRETLNEFLGFEGNNNNNDEDDDESSRKVEKEEKEEEEEEEKEEGDKKLEETLVTPASPPLSTPPSDVPSIVISPPQTEETTPALHTLVKLNDM